MLVEKLYQETILEHNRKPRNRMVLARATHHARGVDALCGDDIRIYLEVHDGIVRRAAFDGEACAVTTAAASLLTTWLAGKTTAEFECGRRAFQDLLARPDGPDAAELGDLNQLKTVGLFPARVRNALLPWRTAASALAGKPGLDHRKGYVDGAHE